MEAGDDREKCYFESVEEREEEICLVVVFGGGTFDTKIYKMKHD